MKKMRTTLVAGFCVLWALDSSAEEEEPEIEQGEIMVQEPLIGLAAFDEVLASGRYLIGPQDEFLIYVTGLREPVVNQVLAEGGLFIPMVGTVEVGGLRLSEAHQKIEEEFRKTIKVGEIDVQLSKPRSFPVPVLGLIRTPGTRQGSAVQRASQIVPPIEQLHAAALDEVPEYGGSSFRPVRQFAAPEVPEPEQFALTAIVEAEPRHQHRQRDVVGPLHISSSVNWRRSRPAPCVLPVACARNPSTRIGQTADFDPHDVISSYRCRSNQRVSASDRGA